ncbi:hypothetical protein Tco_0660760 [Tanacetum coccineum]
MPVIQSQHTQGCYHLDDKIEHETEKAALVDEDEDKNQGDMDKAATTLSTYYVSVRKSEKYRNLRAFMFGQSVGGMVTMLIYLQSDSGTWTGLISATPLFVLPEAASPSKFLEGVVLGSALANVIAGLVYSEIGTDVL